MKQCKLCGEEFTDGQVQGGVLTRHVRSEHGLSKKEYVIETQYNGDPPECQCGMCNEMPYFDRGSFSDYALGHDKHKWQEDKYIELYGNPTCNRPQCENGVGFKRGEPKKYCSHSCMGKHVGFGSSETQKAIVEAVKSKYGVENISKLDEIGSKISKAKQGQNPWDAVSSKERIEKWKERISESSKQHWKDTEYREAVLSSLADCMNDPTKLSKPHKIIRDKLSLNNRGFESEQIVEGYIADELNEQQNVVIEVHGDYVHANPNIYDPNDVIRLVGSEYTAKEKWKSDNIKRQNLESAGYDVIVIWWSEFQENPKKFDRKIEQVCS